MAVAEKKLTDRLCGKLTQIEAIRRGVKYAAFTQIVDELDLADATVADFVGLTTRTLARRKAGREAFSPGVSERMLRLSRLYDLATDVFENSQLARAWLNTPNMVLQNQIPLSLIDTDVGARQVEDALLRIEYGVYA